MNKNVVFVIYDSIANSVFEGQVLEPLLKKLNSGLSSHAYIVSFEKKLIKQELIDQISQAHPKLSVIIVRCWPFIVQWFLGYQARRLKKIIARIQPDEIIARGALSGLLVIKSFHEKLQSPITIQARGLLAEEYRSEHKKASWPMSLVYSLRAWQYESIERIVYGEMQKKGFYTIETVSAALEEYMMRTFGANPACFTRAQCDIPARVASEKIQQWRACTRAQLGIADQAMVYCFSGAVKSWQDPSLVINYFDEIYKTNSTSFLLILTPDKDRFALALKNRLSPDAYQVLSVAHNQIYEYMAVADIGLVFREAGVVSWVSRPVKAMEYEAVGLTVIHNNTVDWLIQRYGTNREIVA